MGEDAKEIVVVPGSPDVSSSTLPRVQTDRRYQGDLFDRLVKFIREVGFPIAVATALIAYMWFVGSKTNDHLSKGAAIMDRAVNVIERLERKIP